ncbi:MAG: MvaI/BcnI restriction endonuclease family protein [Sedimentisphaerales bacterium]|nr:MvaI/BcnI restriction endonuclease family protein [Sedimentisphaerales bacterium]
MNLITKEELIQRLREIRSQGWIKNARHGNVGGVGNTLEDMLGIEENNLPIPNAAEWELKCQRAQTNSLTTLFHMEPSPRAAKFVPKMLLPLYGWQHDEAGVKYPSTEMSFRQTISGRGISDRGFTVQIDNIERKVLISFNSNNVDGRHRAWLDSVRQRAENLNELNPQPYWGFDDLCHKAGTKLLNCFYIRADVKRINGMEHFKYSDILMLKKFSIDGFLKAIEKGHVLVDFDARTGHNHGTKFRLRQNYLPELYEKSVTL